MIDQYQSVSLLAMFMIGLMGSGHCVGMCGGIATALGVASQSSQNGRLVLGYNLGRVSSYAIAGAAVASLGYWGKSYLALGPWLRILAGVILVLMGCYLAGWWRVLLALEKLGARLWQRVQPLGRRLMPVRSTVQAIGLGMVWGWLPCGLVYTALAYAAASANTVNGALLMVAFGAGTAPAMVLGGVLTGSTKQFLQARSVRIVIACMMIAFGGWTLAGATTHLLPVSGDGGVMESHQHH